MKFLSNEDKKLFLIESNRIDLFETVDDAWEPSPELLELYVKRRKELISKRKEFRRSQSSKESWRKNRYTMLKGIRKYHKSTYGKRMHRALGDFLATKISNKESTDRGEMKYESLKAMSSLRTHLYIEASYYMPVDEQLDFDDFMDEAVYASIREERRIFEETKEYDEKDIDILCRCTDPKTLLQCVCELNGKTYDDKMLEDLEKMINEDSSYPEVFAFFNK